jgi:hypothetical protein
VVQGRWGGLREVLGRESSVGGHAILTLVLPSGLEEAAEKLAAQLREEASSGAEGMEVEAEEAVSESTLACASGSRWHFTTSHHYTLNTAATTVAVVTIATIIAIPSMHRNLSSQS